MNNKLSIFFDKKKYLLFFFFGFLGLSSVFLSGCTFSRIKLPSQYVEINIKYFSDEANAAATEVTSTTGGASSSNNITSSLSVAASTKASTTASDQNINIKTDKLWIDLNSIDIINNPPLVEASINSQTTVNNSSSSGSNSSSQNTKPTKKIPIIKINDVKTKNRFLLWYLISKLYLGVYSSADQSRAQLTQQYYSSQFNYHKSLNYDNSEMKKLLGDKKIISASAASQTQSTTLTTSPSMTDADIVFSYSKANILNQGDGFSNFPKAYYLFTNKLFLDLTSFSQIIDFQNSTVTNEIKIKDLTNLCNAEKCKASLKTCSDKLKKLCTKCTTDKSVDCQKTNCSYILCAYQSDKNQLILRPNLFAYYYSWFKSNKYDEANIDEVKTVFNDWYQKNVWPEEVKNKLTQKIQYYTSDRLSVNIKLSDQTTSLPSPTTTQQQSSSYNTVDVATTITNNKIIKLNDWLFNNNDFKIAHNEDVENVKTNDLFKFFRFLKFNRKKTLYNKKISNQYLNYIKKYFRLSLPNSTKISELNPNLESNQKLWVNNNSTSENSSQSSDTNASKNIAFLNWKISDILFSVFGDFKIKSDKSGIDPDATGKFIQTTDTITEEKTNCIICCCCCCENDQCKKDCCKDS